MSRKKFIDAVKRINIQDYEICQGVRILYNDIFTKENFFDDIKEKHFIEINYCKEGRYECEFGNNTIGYMAQGDFAINRYSNPPKKPCFSLGYYVGITIFVDLNKISPIVNLPEQNLSINLNDLWEKICPEKNCFFLYSDKIIQSIFDLLYKLSDNTRNQMHLLKWHELLIYLSSDDLPKMNFPKNYLPYNQIETIKAVEKYLVANIHKHITINELSYIFSIDTTTLKKRFRIVFGKPIFTYMRIYRCNMAAIMLKESNSTFSEIANQLGYANSSKLSSAFNRLFGISPSEYRNLLNIKE